MNPEYLRIDDLTLIELNVSARDWVWLNQLPDVEYRNDYCCHFVLKDTQSHTAIALKFGAVFS